MSSKILLPSFIPRLGMLLLGLFLAPISPLSAGEVSVTNYGHSSLLIKGAGKSVLLNPFKAVGCAAGLKEPRVNVDVILASSELADEGARIAKGIFLVKPGSYQIKGMNIEGFTVDHDRVGGRRFGTATLWKWRQGGIDFAHLGGAAGFLKPEDKVLLGRPDVLIIAVGGGTKVYDGVEAASVVRDLRPRRVIPVQYVTGDVPVNCDLTGMEPFKSALAGVDFKFVGRDFSIRTKLDNKLVIYVPTNKKN